MIAVRLLGVSALCVGAGCVLAAQPPAPAATAVQPAPPSTVPAVETASLGRLFFTPAQRSALDDARRRPPSAVAAATAPPLPPPPEYVTLNGVVRRSDGTTTVWLNNKPVRGRRSDEGLQIAPATRSTPAGNVTVLVPQTGRVVDLKVGQHVDVTSGQVDEAYRATRRQQVSVAEPPPDAPGRAEPRPQQRRTSRDSELLREFLREMDGPASTRPDPAPGGASTTP